MASTGKTHHTSKHQRAQSSLGGQQRSSMYAEPTTHNNSGIGSSSSTTHNHHQSWASYSSQQQYPPGLSPELSRLDGGYSKASSSSNQQWSGLDNRGMSMTSPYIRPRDESGTTPNLSGNPSGQRPSPLVHSSNFPSYTDPRGSMSTSTLPSLNTPNSPYDTPWWGHNNHAPNGASKNGDWTGPLNLEINDDMSVAGGGMPGKEHKRNDLVSPRRPTERRDRQSRAAPYPVSPNPIPSSRYQPIGMLPPAGMGTGLGIIGSGGRYLGDESTALSNTKGHNNMELPPINYASQASSINGDTASQFPQQSTSKYMQPTSIYNQTITTTRADYTPGSLEVPGNEPGRLERVSSYNSAVSGGLENAYSIAGPSQTTNSQTSQTLPSLQGSQSWSADSQHRNLPSLPLELATASSAKPVQTFAPSGQNVYEQSKQGWSSDRRRSQTSVDRDLISSRYPNGVPEHLRDDGPPTKRGRGRPKGSKTKHSRKSVVGKDLTPDLAYPTVNISMETAPGRFTQVEPSLDRSTVAGQVEGMLRDRRQLATPSPKPGSSAVTSISTVEQLQNAIAESTKRFRQEVADILRTTSRQVIDSTELPQSALLNALQEASQVTDSVVSAEGTVARPTLIVIPAPQTVTTHRKQPSIQVPVTPVNPGNSSAHSLQSMLNTAETVNANPEPGNAIGNAAQKQNAPYDDLMDGTFVQATSTGADGYSTMPMTYPDRFSRQWIGGSGEMGTGVRQDYKVDLQPIQYDNNGAVSGLENNLPSLPSISQYPDPKVYNDSTAPAVPNLQAHIYAPISNTPVTPGTTFASHYPQPATVNQNDGLPMSSFSLARPFEGGADALNPPNFTNQTLSPLRFTEGRSFETGLSDTYKSHQPETISGSSTNVNHRATAFEGYTENGDEGYQNQTMGYVTGSHDRQAYASRPLSPSQMAMAASDSMDRSQADTSNHLDPEHIMATIRFEEGLADDDDGDVVVASVRPDQPTKKKRVVHGPWKEAEGQRLRQLSEESKGKNKSLKPEEVDWDWVCEKFGKSRSRHQILIKAVYMGLKATSTHACRLVKQKQFDGREEEVPGITLEKLQKVRAEKGITSTNYQVASGSQTPPRKTNRYSDPLSTPRTARKSKTAEDNKDRTQLTPYSKSRSSGRRGA